VPLRIRTIRAADRRAARALIEQELGGSPYLETPLWALDTSLERETPEAAALVAERGGEVVGLALYGEYAGARGAGRIYLVVVTAGARLQGIGLRLLAAVHQALVRRGARFVLAELSDDAIMRPGLELLERYGYEEEGRVEDLFRPGVALRLMRRNLEP
jgi:GNAT superfamily N-acetyltransferase